MQVDPELKEPPRELNDTIPVGVIEVPTPDESETVAVQSVGEFTGTVDGEQESSVEESLWSTLITIDAELGPKLGSPEYTPVIVVLPSLPARGVYSDEQEPEWMVQVTGLKLPAPVDTKLTPPVGA